MECFGSRMFISDFGSVFFPSRIRIFPSRILDSHQRIKYFNPKKWILSTQKYDPSCSSRIRIFYPSRIPEPVVKKAPDPWFGSATLEFWKIYFLSPSRPRRTRERNWRPSLWREEGAEARTVPGRTLTGRRMEAGGHPRHPRISGKKEDVNNRRPLCCGFRSDIFSNWVLFGTDPDRNRVTWETPSSEAIPFLSKTT